MVIVIKDDGTIFCEGVECDFKQLFRDKCDCEDCTLIKIHEWLVRRYQDRFLEEIDKENNVI